MDKPDSIFEKNSYIIKDIKTERALSLFCEKVRDGATGLCVTRTNPSEIKKAYSLNTGFLWLNSADSRSGQGYQSASDIDDVHKHICHFIKDNPGSVVLLDRIDYLINIHGFGSVLKFIYSLNDQVSANKAVLMLNINPEVLDSREMSLIEQEFHELPRPKLETELQDDLSEIMSFINDSSQKVSFKDISKRFSITKTTTRKRINRMAEKGLVEVRKNGRNKIIRLTDLGRSLL